MVDLPPRTMANIHQNITTALGLDAVLLVTTIAGITGLWPAILADKEDVFHERGSDQQGEDGQ
jgi:Cd2+/Zn2+-exporting ATPase